MKAVILAGGSGTRLWPMSREHRPKQFTNVIGEKLLIRDTYDRLAKVFPAEKIYFSVTPTFAQMLREEFPHTPANQIIVEPGRRDTGPAMGYVAAVLERTDPDEPVVFVPADHFIENDEAFLRCLTVGCELVNETGRLVDIGITPAFPSTILGYTKIGKEEAVRDGVHIFAFAGHTEKPEYAVAKAYVESGEYLWHANYYTWTPRKFMAAFDAFAPEMASVFREICALDPTSARVAELFNALPKISFDYAVTEKLDPGSMLVLRGDFGWSDVGAWDTLYDRLADSGGNVTRGSVVTLDTEGSLVYADAGKPVAVLGVSDLVIVDTDDVLLVTTRDRAQQIKRMVDEFKTRNLHDLL